MDRTIMWGKREGKGKNPCVGFLCVFSSKISHRRGKEECVYAEIHKKINKYNAMVCVFFLPTPLSHIKKVFCTSRVDVLFFPIFFQIFLVFVFPRERRIFFILLLPLSEKKFFPKISYHLRRNTNRKGFFESNERKNTNKKSHFLIVRNTLYSCQRRES